MDKMRMESVDITDQNIEKIGALFPNCITEAKDENGKLTRAINFELLKQELSKDIIVGDEAYEFTWVGKKAAIVEANKPIRKTLRPYKEESVDWDTTENLYIEGDNLEVLKLLQESYLGKVKMIYIDPPYNTGNDFIYEDDFKQSSEDYNEESGAVDKNGDRMFKNTDSNGRFHSDWCSMIYSRLKLAKNLMSKDGIIAISIDDHEEDSLKMICDEIFGEGNFIAKCPRKTVEHIRKLTDAEIQVLNDYILIYCKERTSCILNKKETGQKTYEYKDERGKFTLKSLQNSGENGTRRARPNLYYPIYYSKITNDFSLDKRDDSIEILPKKVKGEDGRWLWSQEKFQKDKNMLYFKNNNVLRKVYYNPKEDQRNYQAEKNWLDSYPNRKGSSRLSELGMNATFDYPKPVDLVDFLLSIGDDEDSIILDFFSGSSTTAEAIMIRNIQDNGHRKYIMVQLPEDLDERFNVASNSDKAKIEPAIKFLSSVSLPHRITELGKERIRRAASDLKKRYPDCDCDFGFRVFKVDESNMTNVYYSPNAYNQDMLTQLESNIKPDRTDLDLLFGCLIEWGLPLSMPYTSENIDGCTVHTYNDGDLIACFNENTPDSVIKEIAKRKPLRAVFRDSSFKGSPEKINVGETFKLLSPDTRVKII